MKHFVWQNCQEYESKDELKDHIRAREIPTSAFDATHNNCKQVDHPHRATSQPMRLSYTEQQQVSPRADMTFRKFENGALIPSAGGQRSRLYSASIAHHRRENEYQRMNQLAGATASGQKAFAVSPHPHRTLSLSPYRRRTMIWGRSLPLFGIHPASRRGVRDAAGK